MAKDPVYGMEVNEKKQRLNRSIWKPFMGIGLAIAAMDQARKSVLQGLSGEE